MAIQMRRGQEVNFDADKMLPGEWAVSLDTKYVRMCFAPGVCVRMATYDAFEMDMAKIEAILAECQSIEEVVTRINSEVSANAKAVAEYTEQAKQYRDEAEQFRDEAKDFVGYGYATKEDAGIIRGGDNYISEDGTLTLTKTTTSRTLTESENGGLKINSIEGESQQTTYSGKNLWSLGDVSGTRYVNATISLDADTYTVSAVVTSNDTDSNESDIIFNYDDGSTVALHFGRNTRTSRTVTLTKPVVSVNLYASNSYANSANDTFTFADIQMEKGSTMTEYEPYVGGTASPNPNYKQDIRSVEISEIGTHGKNLLEVKREPLTSNGITFTCTGDGGVVVNGTNSGTESLFGIVPNIASLPSIIKREIEYIASLKDNGLGVGFQVYQYVNSSWNMLANVSSSNNNIPFVISKDATGLQIRLRVSPNASISNKIVYPMIRKADVEDATYEPYTESREELSETIILRGIGNAKDVLCKQNGVYGVLRKFSSITFDGTEAWVRGKANESERYFNTLSLDKGQVQIGLDESPNGYCTHFQKATRRNSYVYATDNRYSVYEKTFTISYNTATTLEEFKTWLASNNVTIDFEIATPTFEPLPLADQIALHRMETFGGVTYLFTDSTIEPIMEVEYGTSKVGGYALGGYQKAEANRLLLEQLNTLTNELATQLVAGSEG